MWRRNAWNGARSSASKRMIMKEAYVRNGGDESMTGLFSFLCLGLWSRQYHDNSFSCILTDTQSPLVKCSPYGQCNFTCADHRSWYDVRASVDGLLIFESLVLGYYWECCIACGRFFTEVPSVYRVEHTVEKEKGDKEEAVGKGERTLSLNLQLVTLNLTVAKLMK